MNSTYCLTKCKLLSLTANFQTIPSTLQPAFGVSLFTPIQNNIQNEPLGHRFYFFYQLFHRDDRCRIWELYKHEEDLYTFLSIHCTHFTARKLFYLSVSVPRFTNFECWDTQNFVAFVIWTFAKHLTQKIHTWFKHSSLRFQSSCERWVLQQPPEPPFRSQEKEKCSWDLPCIQLDTQQRH